MRIGPQRRLLAKELVLSNCGDGEDSWEPLDCKEIKQVNPKGYQPWISIGRTDAEVESLILWPPDAKSGLTGKAPDAGRDWRRRGWQRMRWLDTITDSKDMRLSKLWEGPWGCKQLDMTQWLKNNNKALLYGTGNSIQYSVMTHIGKESKKSGHTYNWSLCSRS